MRFNFDASETSVTLVGELTFSDHIVFLEVSKRLFSAKSPTITIDLSKLEFIDSAGLGMLLITRDEAKNSRQTLILRSPQGQVKRMFSVTKFDTLFTVEA